MRQNRYIASCLWGMLFLCMMVTAQASTIWRHAQYDMTDTGESFTLNYEGDRPQYVTRWLERQNQFVLDVEDVRSLPKIPLALSGVYLHKAQLFPSEKGARLVLQFNAPMRYDLIEADGQLSIDFHMRDPESDGSKMPAISIDDLLFTKTEAGSGILTLHTNHAPEMDFDEVNNTIRMQLKNSELKETLERTFEVSDLDTPVRYIQAYQAGKDVDLVIIYRGKVSFIADQHDDKVVVEVMPVTEIGNFEDDENEGSLLNMKFQDIEVRAVLQLLADVSHFNIVASDSVTGSLTLNLNDVTWRQALNLIFKVKGLDYRQEDNILLVAPIEELANQERTLLSSTQEIQDLAPIVSKLIPMNYAKAEDIASLIGSDEISILSPRGKVTFDERTNALIIYETEAKMLEVDTLLEKLDQPIRQVLVEARIVKTNDNFEQALGTKVGTAARVRRQEENVWGFSGSKNSRDGASDMAVSDQNPSQVSLANRLAVDIPRTLTSGSAGLAITLARLPGDMILDLELTALESEGLAEIISSPRLLTLDQSTAYIEAGEEIPYLQTSSSGAGTVAFKSAVLRLEVTPQITPDDHLLLELKVNQDARGAEASGNIAIDTQVVETSVIVDNGETIILGGIYKQTLQHEKTKVPILGDIPLLGRIFRDEKKVNKKEETLIFITPKIIDEQTMAEVNTPNRQVRSLEESKVAEKWHKPTI